MHTQRSKTKRIRPSQSRRGFTLLELLLVLAILVVLGGIVVVNVAGTSAAANADATQAQLKMLKSNIQMYQIRMNSLPETLEALRDGPSDSDKKAKMGRSHHHRNPQGRLGKRLGLPSQW